MILSTETYYEYQADCSKCHKTVLEVIESADIEHWDERCGVCPKCKKLFCGKCVVEKGDKIFCPDCGGELLEFFDCGVYDLISILEHDCQPFERKSAKP